MLRCRGGPVAQAARVAEVARAGGAGGVAKGAPSRLSWSPAGHRVASTRVCARWPAVQGDRAVRGAQEAPGAWVVLVNPTARMARTARRVPADRPGWMATPALSRS